VLRWRRRPERKLSALRCELRKDLRLGTRLPELAASFWSSSSLTRMSSEAGVSMQVLSLEFGVKQ
jgi:hypothetical protein